MLRDWQPGDADAMVVLFDDPAVALRTPLPSPFTLDRAGERLARAAAHDLLLLAVTEDGQQPLGEVLLGPDGTCGWVLGAAHRGRGLAARAVRLLLAAATGTWGMTRFHAEIEPDNASSAAVARAAGFALVTPGASVVEDKGRRVVLDRWER